MLVSARLRTAALAALLCAPSLHVSADGAARRDVKRSFPARPGLVVELTNLAGEVRVEGGPGTSVEVSATVHAEGSDAERLADQLKIVFDERSDRLRVVAEYPLDEHRTYRYPGSRRRDEGAFSWFGLNRSTFEYQGRRVTVVSGRGGRGVTLWADVRLRVPAGVGVEARNSVGVIDGSGVAGALTLESASGDVRVAGGAGATRVDTGSGDIELRDRDGRVRVETGSGDVSVSRVKGDADVETGSGDVRLTGVEASAVKASTGSGDVTLRNVTGSLALESGSGEIRCDGVARVESLRAGTGSGSIELDGDLSGVKQVDVSTGSGDVSLRLTRAFPMSVTATTSSGSIDVDAPGLRTLRRKEHELVAEVQGGGADVRIDTSSGNVRIDAP